MLRLIILIAILFCKALPMYSQSISTFIGDAVSPVNELNANMLDINSTATKKPRKQWFIDISLSHFATRYGRADFDLNGYLDYRMRDIDYDDGAFRGLQGIIAIKKEIVNRLDIGLSFGYFKTTQFLSLKNHLLDIDRQQGLSSTFYIMGMMGFDHKHLTIGIPIQYRPIKGLFFEAMPNISFNVTQRTDDGWNSWDPRVNAIYGSVIDNNGVYVSKNILFARGALGYEYKGLFVKAFYERNLTNVTSNFSFRGKEFTIEYPKWVNWGVNLGVSLRLGKKPIVGYDR